MIIQDITKKIEPIFERYGVQSAGIFGSRARGDERSNSDVDILVRLRKTIGLFRLAELRADLSDTLHLNVDLVTEGALSPYLRDSVMRDLKVIYEGR